MNFSGKNFQFFGRAHKKIMPAKSNLSRKTCLSLTRASGVVKKIVMEKFLLLRSRTKRCGYDLKRFEGFGTTIVMGKLVHSKSTSVHSRNTRNDKKLRTPLCKSVQGSSKGNSLELAIF